MVLSNSEAFALPELIKYGMVELMLNPKNKTANAIELVKSACSPLPVAPNIRVIRTEMIKPSSVLITCAPKVNDILFLIDNVVRFSDSLFDARVRWNFLFQIEGILFH